MKKLGHGLSRKRYTCYTIPQAMTFLNTATIKKQPKQVLLHLGTNDVVNSQVDQLKKDYKELITLARKSFPEARIYISSVFVRMKKNDPLNKTIQNINSHLEDFCDRTQRYTFISNRNILHQDMRDPKHVNPTGFYMFVCNIRRTMFNDILPQRRSGNR